jgi:pimeloyl-ACP methyl ester carboxylesterase
MLLASAMLGPAALGAMSDPRNMPLRPRRLGATYAVPTWMPESAMEVNEPSAVLALGRIRRSTVTLQRSGLEVATSFWRTDKFARAESPKLVFLHGADSNCLEWRYVAEKLGASGLDCTCVDWWSGGFTDREPINKALKGSGGKSQPSTLIREHLEAFCEQQFFDPDGPGTDEAVILIGASLGGAVAIDWAAANPERVKALILIDSSGESYQDPSSEAAQALAPAVLAAKSLAAWVSSKAVDVGWDTSEEMRIAGLHRTEPGWREAYGAYLTSGGHQAAVTPEVVRSLGVPTLVLWGTEDKTLPLRDAYAFQRDLGPNCYGVREVRGAGHSPHLDDPAFVAKHLGLFLEELDLTGGAAPSDLDGGAARRQRYRDNRPPES